MATFAHFFSVCQEQLCDVISTIFPVFLQDDTFRMILAQYFLLTCNTSYDDFGTVADTNHVLATVVPVCLQDAVLG